MGLRIDIQKRIGLKYNSLTVISEVETRVTKSGNKIRMLLCKCDCGVTKEFQMGDVFGRYVKSCGCYNKTQSSKRAIKRNFKHGMFDTSEYNTWRSMKKRCINPNHRAFKDYGGRGITVCDRWVNSFINFISDMGNKPSKNHSLDRIDNNKGYSKENCRWATKTQQCRNQRTNRSLEINGETKTISEWSQLSGIKWQTIHYRAFISKNKDVDILKKIE